MNEWYSNSAYGAAQQGESPFLIAQKLWLGCLHCSKKSFWSSFGLMPQHDFGLALSCALPSALDLL